MAYLLGNGIWNSVFAVPNAVCDKHIKMAGGHSVKALLLILRHGGKLELTELASMLGQSVSDAQDAVNYWVENEILRPLEGDAISEDGNIFPGNLRPALAYTAEPEPTQVLKPEPPKAEEPPKSRVETVTAHRPRLTTGEINELAAGDKNVTYLMQETQAVLGKPLSPVASSTIASLYSYSGMTPDLILMLVQYCASIGKSSMHYIARVADDWLEKGIDSHERAEAEILRLTRQEQMEGRVKRAFGIYDRNLVTSEKEFIRKWEEELKLDMALVNLAYERTIELKGKLSFPYINAILTNWHEKGIKTPAQALQELRAKSGGKQQEPTQGTQSSYDISELEKMIAGGDL
jgi:DnaD/phage-associated family protein